MNSDELNTLIAARDRTITLLKADKALLVTVFTEASAYVTDYKGDGSVETAQATSMDAAITAATAAAAATR